MTPTVVLVLLVVALNTCCLGVHSLPPWPPVHSYFQSQPLSGCDDAGHHYKIGVMLNPIRDQSLKNAVTMALDQVNGTGMLGAAELDMEFIDSNPCTVEEADGPTQALIARNVTVSDASFECDRLSPKCKSDVRVMLRRLSVCCVRAHSQ